MHMKSALKLAILGGTLLASAHPGHHEPSDGPDVQLYKRNVQTGLQKCSESQNNGIQVRVEACRRAMVALHRRHLCVRDTNAVLNKFHQATRPMPPSKSEKEIFNSQRKCVASAQVPKGKQDHLGFPANGYALTSAKASPVCPW